MEFKASLVDTVADVARAIRKGLTHEQRFRGAFGSYEEAMAGVRTGKLRGYGHEILTGICYETMSQVTLSDYPVIHWLRQIVPPGGRVLDAGGHLGTKYRAFRRHLEGAGEIDWWIYDLPPFVAEGTRRARAEGLSSLHFVDDIAAAPPADVVLGSGVMQYLDVPLSDLISRLASRPRHLLLNKVATRDGPTVVMLEDFGAAEVPYQIRNRSELVASIRALGYRLADEWEIPHLSHNIPGHPRLGRSVSLGFYAVADHDR